MLPLFALSFKPFQIKPVDQHVAVFRVLMTLAFPLSFSHFLQYSHQFQKFELQT